MIIFSVGKCASWCTEMHCCDAILDMSARQRRFRGTKFHRIDIKGRISIPAEWRSDLDETVYLVKAQSHGVINLKILTEAALDRYYAQIESMDWEPARKNAMIERLDSESEELKINVQGKLLIPKAICDSQGFTSGDELVLSGRGLHFEVYTVRNHDEMLKKQAAVIAEADAQLGIFGKE